MTEPIHIPIDMGIKPKATLNLTNTVTGEVQTMSMGAPEGMILDHYLDWAMERGLGLLGTTTFNRCYLGTGDTPVQPTDTGLSGSQLAMSSSSVLLEEKSRDFHLSTIKEVETVSNLAVGNRGLAVTEDGQILIVARDSNLEKPSLEAFLVDDLLNSDFPEPIPVDDFSVYEVGSNLSCKYLSCGGDFLSLSTGDDIRVYKRTGNSFVFYSSLVLGFTVDDVSISPDGNYVVVTPSTTSRIYVYKIESGEITIVNSDGNEYVSVGTIYGTATFCPDSKHFMVGAGVGSIRIFSLNDLGDNYSQVDSVSYSDSSYSYYFSKLIPLSSKDVIAIARRYRSANPTAYPVFRFQKLNDNWNISSGLLENVIHSMVLFHNTGVRVTSTGKIQAVYTNEKVEFTHQKSYSGGSYLGTMALSGNMVFIRNENRNLDILRVDEKFNSKVSYGRKWTFPAGTGTGVVNEVAVQATSGTGESGNNRYFLRFVLPEGFEKTDLHQLEVEVEAEIENPGIWEGVIPGGSRDESDLSYRITMSEGQFRDFITTGYNNLSTWFGTSGTPRVRIGTSNEDTDLVFDRENIRGHEIEYISSTAIREVIPYVPGSLERTIRLFLEVTQGNGKIGEIVFGNRFCRVTFDPPLNKYDPEGVDAGRDPSTRLYMNLIFGWKREGE